MTIPAQQAAILVSFKTEANIGPMVDIATEMAQLETALLILTGISIPAPNAGRIGVPLIALVIGSTKRPIFQIASRTIARVADAFKEQLTLFWESKDVAHQYAVPL
jgi:hypothetical protein